MKKFFALSLSAFVLAGTLGMSSCRKKDATVFYTVPDQTICFPASAFVSGTGEASTFEVSVSDIQAAFTQAEVPFSVADVQSLKMKNFEVMINSPSTNFDDISGVHLYAKAPGASGNGDKVAFSDNSSTGTTTIPLSALTPDIKPLLNNDKIVMTVLTYNNKNNTPQTCFTLKAGMMEILTNQ